MSVVPLSSKRPPVTSDEVKNKVDEVASLIKVVEEPVEKLAIPLVIAVPGLSAETVSPEGSRTAKILPL